MMFRWIVIALSLIISGYQLLKPPAEKDGVETSWSLENYKENIKLGLDLKGGIFMQLEVDEEDAVRQYLEEQSGIIKGYLETDNDFTIGSATSDFDARTVTLQNVASTKFENMRDEIRDRFGDWNVRVNGSTVTMKLRDVPESRVKDEAVTQTVNKIQSRVDELGVTEPVINRTIGSNRIVLELAGADDSSRVHKIVREPGKLEWRLMVRGTQESPTKEGLGTLGPNARAFQHAESGTWLALENVMLTAKNIAAVGSTTDDRGAPAVSVKLDRAGGETMATKSATNVGNRLAIVLDGKVISAPSINSKLGDSFIIQGLKRGEVEDLIIKIQSGSLPAQVNILEERSIGPTLGRDAIRSGSTAAGIGLILVMVFIIAYYRKAGVFALVALILNLIIMMGMLSAIGAVLTLPGIAGFILTIGMAVDANVLVFERIREELRTGMMPKNAVDIGYKSAFVTIMDANITTFLAAFFLYLMGEGPVKGFAVMLMIGIVSSIFTAVFCSRTFFLASMRDSSATELSIWPVWKSNKVTLTA